MLKEVEKEMSRLNATQLDKVYREEEARLNEEHERGLLMREMFWHQRSRIKWVVFGDRTSAFFHASTVTRRRRNAIGSIWVPGSGWVIEEREIRRVFLAHFKGIYTKGVRANINLVYSSILLCNFSRFPYFIGPSLDSIPSAQEIQKALMALGPHKAAGPDGGSIEAFDRMDWNFLDSIIPLYRIPNQMRICIMAYVRSSEFSIVLNGGGGGGSFKPSCGLRQGCSLSPYLFIMDMDLLSRSLADLVKAGFIQGVKMAPSCSSITDVLYADDLLLLGRANLQEAVLFKQALEAFSTISGQQIGPAKSSIWFSQSTAAERCVVADFFGVNQEIVSLSYLGALITTPAQAFDLSS
ncbi:uncharacterized protein LOC144544825 [Carex rostrata]